MDILSLSLDLLLCFFILLSASTAFSDDDLQLPPDARFLAAQAEELIRRLNLSPRDASARSPGEGGRRDDGGMRIVEWRLELPGLAGGWGGRVSVEGLSQLELPRLAEGWGGGGGGNTVEDLGHHAGYYRLAHSYDARMFYFFFESRNSKKDPVVIWLTGGPGCSSELAVFFENGPFAITDNMSLVWNNYGWDKISNLIYVDQPTGTGFSYSSDSRDLRHDETGVSNDLYDFLQAFFAKHPEYAENDFYITGESYAGHYIPAFAGRIHQGNKAREGIHINLKGLAIGNGLTDPAIQYQAYTDYALDMGIIKETDYERINKYLPACESAIKQCGTGNTDSCLSSYMVCNNIFNSILRVAGNINYYDIRKQCDGVLCYDFSNLEEFLNEKSVKDALGVGDLDFVSCSPSVYQAMLTDWMRNLEVGIPALIDDGIKLLVYAGEYDLICNWLGNSRWVHSMEWSGQKEFASSPSVPFVVDGVNAGLLKSHGPLSFLKVHDAGHMVPMDQPRASLEMLGRWIKGDLAADSSPPEPQGTVSDMPQSTLIK